MGSAWTCQEAEAGQVAGVAEDDGKALQAPEKVDEDVSWVSDGSVTKKVLEPGAGALPREGAKLWLRVDNAADDHGTLPGFTGPKDLDFQAGNGEVCDALECAAVQMRRGERALVAVAYPELVTEPLLGLDDLTDQGIGRVELTVQLLSLEDVAPEPSSPPAEIMEFALSRWEVGKALQTTRRRFALAALRYIFVGGLLQENLSRFSNEDQQQAGGIMHTSIINKQASLAYWSQQEALRKAHRNQAPGTGRLLVCHDLACRQAGAEALHAEIEELLHACGETCSIEKATCFGRCRHGPVALASRKSKNGKRLEVTFEELDSLSKSESVVRSVTGRQDLAKIDPMRLKQLFVSRATNLAASAQAALRFNRALGHLAQAQEVAHDDEVLPDVVFAQAEALEAAGLVEQALHKIEWLLSISSEAPDDELRLRRARLLAKMGRPDELEQLKAEPHLAGEVCRAFDGMHGEVLGPGVRRPVEGYSLWCLASVDPVSKHSALFRFEARESTSRRGQASSAWQLWHVTLLAEVGANSEGPLGWVEREYTPVSSDSDWNEGRLELLVKVYPLGLASHWFAKLNVGTDIFISQPTMTLMAPSLVTIDAMKEAFTVQSVLFVAGGTGLAPALGVLHFFKEKDLPIQLVYCCQADDVLLLERLQAFAQQRKSLTAILVALSPASADDEHGVGFPSGPLAPTSESFPQLTFVQGRITKTLLAEVVERLGFAGLRAVVCGPQAMNDAVASSLQELGLLTKQLTVMKA
eukprot:TRINITY_DN90177_c0_g1_i1.p1 TRINITY_DN90177_c0_g1~~TRINITY_DN90177_c0_g1_i1.p1  ORF type:complete len:766 (+),score=177.59 TRINITY_DN90177_c0_g1_i1:37-2298(+)